MKHSDFNHIAMLVIYQRVSSHTIPLNHHFPMVFLWFPYGKITKPSLLEGSVPESAGQPGHEATRLLHLLRDLAFCCSPKSQRYRNTCYMIIYHSDNDICVYMYTHIYHIHVYIYILIYIYTQYRYDIQNIA